MKYVLVLIILLSYSSDTSTLTRILSPTTISSDGSNIYFEYDVYAEVPQHDKIDPGRIIVINVDQIARIYDKNARAVVKIVHFQRAGGVSERIICRDLQPNHRCPLNINEGNYIIEYTIKGGDIDFVTTDRIRIAVFKNSKGQLEVMSYTTPLGVNLGELIKDRIDRAGVDSIIMMILFLGIFGAAMYARGMGMFAGIFDLLYPRLPTPKVVLSHKPGSINYAPAIGDISKSDSAEALIATNIEVRSITGSGSWNLNAVQLMLAQQLGLVTRMNDSGVYYVKPNQEHIFQAFLNAYNRNIQPYLGNFELIERLTETTTRSKFEQSYREFVKELEANGLAPRHAQTITYYVNFAVGQLIAAAVAKKTREEPLDKLAEFVQVWKDKLSKYPILKGVAHMVNVPVMSYIFYPFRASRGMISFALSFVYPFKLIKYTRDPLRQIRDEEIVERVEEKIKEADESIKQLADKNVASAISGAFGIKLSERGINIINNIVKVIPNWMYDAMIFPVVAALVVGPAASVRTSFYRTIRYYHTPAFHKELIKVTPDNVAEAFVVSLQTASRNLSTIILINYLSKRYPDLVNDIRKLIEHTDLHLDISKIRQISSRLDNLKEDQELNRLLQELYAIQKLEIIAMKEKDYSIYVINDPVERAIFERYKDLLRRYVDSSENIIQGIERLEEFFTRVKMSDGEERLANIDLLRPEFRDKIDSSMIGEYLALSEDLNNLQFASIYKPIGSQQEQSVAIFNDASDGLIALVVANMLEMYRSSVIKSELRSNEQISYEYMPGVREGFDITMLKILGKENVTVENHHYLRMLYTGDISESVAIARQEGIREEIIDDAVRRTVIDAILDNVDSDSIREAVIRWDGGKVNTEVGSYIRNYLSTNLSHNADTLIAESSRIISDVVVMNELYSKLNEHLSEREIVELMDNYVRSRNVDNIRDELKNRGLAESIINGVIEAIQIRIRANYDLNSTWNWMDMKNSTDEFQLTHLVKSNSTIRSEFVQNIWDNNQATEASRAAVRVGVEDNYERQRLFTETIRRLSSHDLISPVNQMSDTELFRALSDPERASDIFHSTSNLTYLSGDYKELLFAIGMDSIKSEIYQTQDIWYIANRKELIEAAKSIAEFNREMATEAGIVSSLRRNERMAGLKIKEIPIIYAVKKNNMMAAERVGEAIRYLAANKGVYQNSPEGAKAEWFQQEIEKQLLQTSTLMQNSIYSKRHLAHTLGAFMVAAGYLNLHNAVIQRKPGPDTNYQTVKNSVDPGDLNVGVVNRLLFGHEKSRVVDIDPNTRVFSKQRIYGMGGHTVWLPEVFNDIDTIIADDELVLRPKSFGQMSRTRAINKSLFRAIGRSKLTDEQLEGVVEKMQQAVSKIPSSSFEAPAGSSVHIVDAIDGRFVHLDQDPGDYGSRYIGKMRATAFWLSKDFVDLSVQYVGDPILALNAFYTGLGLSPKMSKSDMMLALHTAMYDFVRLVMYKRSAEYRNEIIDSIHQYLSNNGVNISRSQLESLLNDSLAEKRIYHRLNENINELAQILPALQHISQSHSNPHIRFMAYVMLDEFNTRIGVIQYLKQQFPNINSIKESEVSIYVKNYRLIEQMFMNNKMNQISNHIPIYLDALAIIDSVSNDKRVLGITGLIGAMNLDNYSVRNLIQRGMVLDTGSNVGHRIREIVNSMNNRLWEGLVPRGEIGFNLRDRLIATWKDLTALVLINKTLAATEYANMYFVNVEHFGHAAAMIQHGYPIVNRMFELAERALVENIIELMDQYRALNPDNPEHIARRTYLEEAIIEAFEELNEFETAYLSYKRGYYMNAWALVVRSPKGVWAGISEYRGADISATFYAGSGLFWPYYIAIMYRVLDQPSILANDGGIRSRRLTEGVYTNLLPQYDPTLADLIRMNNIMRLHVANYFANRSGYDDIPNIVRLFLLDQTPNYSGLGWMGRLNMVLGFPLHLVAKSFLQPLTPAFVRDIVAHNYMISMFSRLQYFSRLYRGLNKSFSTTSTIDTPQLSTSYINRLSQMLNDPNFSPISKFTSAKQFNRYPVSDLPYAHVWAYLPLPFSPNMYSHWYPISFYATIIGMGTVGLPFGYIVDNLERIFGPHIIPNLQNWLDYRASKIRATEGLLISDWEEKLLTYRPSHMFHHWLSPFVGTYYDLPGYGHIDQSSGNIVMNTLNERILLNKDVFTDRYNMNQRRWSRYFGYYEERTYYSTELPSYSLPFMMFPMLYVVSPITLLLKTIPTSPSTAPIKALIEEYILPYSSISGALNLTRKSLAYMFKPLLPPTEFRALAGDMIGESQRSITPWNIISENAQYRNQIIAATGYSLTPESVPTATTKFIEQSAKYRGIDRYRRIEGDGQSESEQVLVGIIKAEMMFTPATGRDIIMNNRNRQLFRQRIKEVNRIRLSGSSRGR
ncbi:MAG: hypothetical protein QXI75_00340 [Candidatus Anstonellales archaeon]